MRAGKKLQTMQASPYLELGGGSSDCAGVGHAHNVTAIIPWRENAQDFYLIASQSSEGKSSFFSCIRTINSAWATTSNIASILALARWRVARRKIRPSSSLAAANAVLSLAGSAGEPSENVAEGMQAALGCGLRSPARMEARMSECTCAGANVKRTETCSVRESATQTRRGRVGYDDGTFFK